MKHSSAPSVFESSVLEETPTLKGKYHTQEAWEAYGKPDRDIVYSGTVSGTVLNLRGDDDDGVREDTRLLGTGVGTRDHHYLHHHHHQPSLQLPFSGATRPHPELQQMNQCLVEGEADDPSSTVMFLETLWTDGECVGLCYVSSLGTLLYCSLSLALLFSLSLSLFHIFLIFSHPFLPGEQMSAIFLKFLKYLE